MWQKRQRVISRTEPELGFGIVLDLDSKKGFLEVLFPTAQERRRYSVQNPPLQRPTINVGDEVVARGEVMRVTAIEERDGLYLLSSHQESYWEYEVEFKAGSHGNAFDQLCDGPLSPPYTYDLRRDGWQIKSKIHNNKVRGLVGPRVTPLPHQLFIAADVSRRPFPRVLLADEVGLGKTIEASLIYSAMKSLGRADRVMVVTPESLVNQWVAELYRRFGDVFSIMDGDRILQEQASLGLSAFLSNQKVIVSMEFLIANREALEQAIEARWDLLIIDEAHHLDWDPEEPNPRWLVAKPLSQASKGLLLLTATPRQHGPATQFGLLNLVDEERFSSYDDFCDEAARMNQVAHLAKNLHQGSAPSATIEHLRALFSEDPQILTMLDQPLDQFATKKILGALVDRHGTGRVLFRNRRERLKGFPKRVLTAVPLEASPAYRANLQKLDPDALSDLAIMDYATGRGVKRSFRDTPSENPRYLWLKDFIASLKGDKALILCASKERVIELKAYLDSALPESLRPGKQVAVFYEDLDVIDRDKQAVLFADPKGAQVLVSSEIGGEGRNFQFTNKLVLADLPRLPDLLEQRIGRLDRIGQAKEIQIYVPWLKNTPEEVFFHWFHEGLNSFESSWTGADPLLEHFADDLLHLFRAFFPKHADYESRHEYLAMLVKRTSNKAKAVRKDLADSVDILVDLNSFHEEEGAALLEMVEDLDDDSSLEFFIRGFLDHFKADYEEFDERGSLAVKPWSLTFLDKFPGISEDQDTVLTFDRELALVREDFVFLSADHPLTESALTMLLDRQDGVASIAKLKGSALGRAGVVVELSFVLEAVGPRPLELGRFLPISVHEVVLNHRGEKVNPALYKKEVEKLVELESEEIPDDREELGERLRPLVQQGMEEAQKWAQNEIKKALARAKDEFAEEEGRLRYLQSVNPTISPKELQLQEQHHEQVLDFLGQTAPRLDGVRLIFLA